GRTSSRHLSAREETCRPRQRRPRADGRRAKPVYVAGPRSIGAGAATRRYPQDVRRVAALLLAIAVVGGTVAVVASGSDVASRKASRPPAEQVLAGRILAQ